ncbi:MAG: dTDP-glucose 4,6-dehydratase [Planctomycetota bacterium]
MTDFSPRRILLTGGAGFIGTNLVRHLLATYPALERLVVLDLMTYAGNPENLAGLAEQHGARYRLVEGDIADQPFVTDLFRDEGFDTVLHLAAESHVDRSIEDPLAFVRTNVVGTATLLHAARSAWKDRKDVRFHHVSTDEVFGSLGESGLFTEDTPYDPSSPYSASKAGSDHLARAWHRTYGLPVTITNCSNNYGPWQFPEKLIPLIIARAVAGEPLPVYGKGLNVRDWLHVTDHCRAIDLVVRRGQVGRTYNVGGRSERTNIAVVHTLCDILDRLRPDSRGSYRRLISFVADRPGHDLRYAIDERRIADELSWSPSVTFEQGMEQTVSWYLAHQSWVRTLVQRHAATKRRGMA